MKRLLSSLLIAALFLGTYPTMAFAGSAEEVEALSAKGAKAYQKKRYEEAIEHFQKAYDIEPVPNLLFNIGKCHEKLKDWDQAIEFYEKFVVAPDVETETREAAQARIKSLEEVQQAELDQREAEEEQKRLAEEKKNKKKKKKNVDKEDPEKVTSGKPDRTLAYVVAGGGLALLGGGAVFGLLASQKQSEFQAANSATEKRDAQSSGRTMALVADGMFVVGAIATVIGVVLFATAKPESDPQLGVWMGKKGAGVGFGMSF